ncbi:DUF4240 domain-containing protein [Methylosinus sp. Sm6]|uniref:DUF4240 domain-containing protein n=1 Tax=Methylosinus sp. Sm6 TaxID=2866948 RepID=UPI001C999599|nr:DUF4240 domain-containing protein [Methylosinus sp. Sm6]MBY6240624.1 DUF4240 domain-containing protein [Methylosinus sp. Sm6]
MDETNFWQIVERVHRAAGDDMELKCRIIERDISALPAAEALDFARLFDTMMGRAYRWPLWGAAFVINGGCGDDTFSDFRASLISRGREAFESAQADPDSLADAEFDAEAWFYEGYQYAVGRGVKTATKGERPSPAPFSDPSGQDWKEDEVYGLFPRLAAKFG